MATPCELITEQMGLLCNCSPVGQYIRIQTPFLYPDGDIIDIFYQEKDDLAILTDLGETMRWLRMQTVSQRKTPKQLQLIADICLTHGMDAPHRDMLMVRIMQPGDLAAAITRLSQCILRISDLWFTFRNKLGESIVDEVEDLLQENNIVFERNPILTGESERVWKPDFRTRGKNHSTLVRVLSTGSRAVGRDQVDRTTVMWLDLSYLRAGSNASQFISLVDDSADVWNPEDITLVKKLSDIAYWSRSNEFLEKIAS